MRIIREKNFQRIITNAYEKGLTRGYGLGQIARKAEANNKGCVLSQIREEVEQILEDNKF